MSNLKERISIVCILTVMLVSMLPVMILGFYNHPTGDDYYYGAEAHRVYEESGSLVAAAAEAVKGAAYDYQTWQGTYSAMFLMRLQPAVFSETAYHWVTSVILIVLTGGIFYLLKPILCGWLKGSTFCWTAVSAVLAVLAVQTVPTPSESMFWYNGSMYYTGYFAVTLFFWGLLLRYLQKPGAWKLAVLIVLAVFLAGGNYISLLPCMLLLVLLLVFLLWKKDRKQAAAIGAVTFAMLAGFAVNAMAPGNAVRQSGMWQIAPWKAVLKALVQGIRYADAWIGKWWLIGAALLTPVLLKLYQRTAFAFRYPLVVVGLLYGIFCSMSCPTFYTMNSTGPARAVAICYYGFLLFSFAAYAYILGYYNRKLQLAAGLPKLLCRSSWCILIAGLLVMQAVSGKLVKCTGAKALQSLFTGEAAAYQEEYEARRQILENTAIEDAVLPPFESRPELLYVGDLSSDPEEPTNVKIAYFYGKKSVSVSCTEE